MNLIYKATNQINNKVYIGQTSTSLEQRKKQHIYNATHKIKKSYFYSALQSYGVDNFNWEILEDNLNIENLNERECYWINYYQSNNPDFGYNMTSGGDNADNLDKWRQKNSEQMHIEAKKGWEKMRQYLLAHPEIDEQRKIKAKQKAQEYAAKHLIEIKQRSYNVYLQHKEQQEETLRKSREARMKAVQCIETQIIYPSLQEAGRQTNISPSNIKYCCDGKRKSAGKDANGNKLHWQYIL